jgi:hypothetical protein
MASSCDAAREAPKGSDRLLRRVGDRHVRRRRVLRIEIDLAPRVELEAIAHLTQVFQAAVNGAVGGGEAFLAQLFR